MGILRTLLALSVVLAHSNALFGISLVGGQVAVQAFYMISGFYMTLVLNERYIGPNKSYKLFISNRILRLWPVYVVVLILAVGLSAVIYNDSSSNIVTPFHMIAMYGSSMSFSTFAFLVFSNLFTLFQDWIVFLGLNQSTGTLFFTSDFKSSEPLVYLFMFVPQAWTIGVEITFYLIAPFICRRNFSFLIVLIIISAAIRIILVLNGFSYDPWNYRFFPTELIFFLFGGVAYHAYKRLQGLNISKVALYIPYLLVFLSTFIYGFVEGELKIYLYLALFGTSIPFIFMLSKRWKVDRYIGELSYPIYISHMFVSVFVSYFKIPTYGGRTFTLVALTIGFSILLNELVAKRIEVIRQKRVQKLS